MLPPPTKHRSNRLRGLRRPATAGVASAAALAAGPIAAMAGTPGTVTGGPCIPHVHRGVLPAWLRDGFSSPQPRIPHAVAAGGRIAGILFGDPLTSPPRATRSNKILWVPRAPVTGITDLRISAQRMRGARVVGRPVGRLVPGGPGPSIIDLPATGCWRLTLRWAGHTDRLDLRYIAAPR